MNRTQKFALNSMATAILQIVTMAVGFITPSLMIRTYGSEINGLVSSINQMISYISLVEAGLSGAAVFSLYRPLANKDKRGINAIVTAAKKYYVKTGYIFSGASMLLAIVYAIMKSTETIAPITIFILVLLLSINGCLDFFVFARYYVILTADQRTYIISLLGTVQVMLKAAVIIFCSLLRLNVLLLYALALIPILIKVIVLFTYCRKMFPFLDFSGEANYEALGRKYDVIYQQILGTVQTGAPTVIATIFLDLVTVSVYSVYNMVLYGINGILSIFISGLPASFGELIAKGEQENLQKTISQFEVAYYYILSIVYGLTLVLLLPFISVYTKNFVDAQYYVPSLAMLIVLNGIVYSIKTPQSMLMISAGMYKEQRWRATLQAAIIVVGGCILTQFYGIQGVLIALICANIYRTIDLMFYVPAHITHSPVMQTFRRMVMVFVEIGVIALPSLFLSFQTTNYYEWLILAAVYGIYAIAVVTVFVLITDRCEFFALAKRMSSIIRRR